MITTYFHYTTDGMLYLMAAFISLSVGLLVLLKDHKSRIHQSFFLITLTGGTWCFLSGLFTMANSDRTSYLFLSINYTIAVPFISFCVYIFSAYWTKREIHQALIVYGLFFAVILGLLGALYSKEIFWIKQFPYGRFDIFRSTVFGNTYFTLIIIHFIFFFVFALRNFFMGWKNTATPHQKIQYRMFIAAMLIGYLGSTDFLVAKDIPVKPLGHITFALFSLTITYTIFRHRFLDIKLVVRRISALLLIYLSLILGIALVLFPFFTRVVLHHYGWTASILIIGSIVGIVMSLGPIIYSWLLRRSYWLKGYSTTAFVHELKSPLTNLESASEMINFYQSPASANPEKVTEYLAMIKENTDRLRLYVNNLLQIAHQSQEVISVEKAPHDLMELINSTCRSFEPQAIKKNISFDILAGEPVIVNIDREKIEQVLTNILSNAIKFSENGAIHIDIQKTDRQFICSIRDEGRGIPRQHVHRIFDRFYQVDKGAKGSGIGLAIAKGWIELHGGEIWAESDGEGKGTKIIFTLSKS